MAPMYDFESASIVDTPYTISLCGIDEYKKAYPKVEESLDKFRTIGIDNILEEIEDERKIIVPEDVKTQYKRFIK